jgi:hypothetical protein
MHAHLLSKSGASRLSGFNLLISLWLGTRASDAVSQLEVTECGGAASLVAVLLLELLQVQLGDINPVFGSTFS